MNELLKLLQHRPIAPETDCANFDDLGRHGMQAGRF